MNRLAALLLSAACLLPALAASAPAGRLLLVDDHGRQLSLLDATSLAPLQRLAAPRPLRGPPKFSPDGRHAYAASTDGWLLQFDLRDLAAVAQVRAGEAIADFAISGDGAWILAGSASPPAVVLFDAQLREVRRYPAASLDGKLQSPVATVHDTGPRRSFVVGFETLPQLWEISYDPAAPPIFDGLVHDYRMGEAIASTGYLGVRRTPLEEPFAALAVAAQGRQVLGTSPGDGTSVPALAVIHLDVRRRIARVPLAVTPAPARLAAFERQGCPLLAVAGPEGAVQVIDAVGWRVSVAAAAWVAHCQANVRPGPHQRVGVSDRQWPFDPLDWRKHMAAGRLRIPAVATGGSMHRRSMLIFLASGASSLAAHAAHGWKPFEDVPPVYLQGLVTTLMWANPHPHLEMVHRASRVLPPGLARLPLPPHRPAADTRRLLESAVLPVGEDRLWRVELPTLARLTVWDVPRPKNEDVIALVGRLGPTILGTRTVEADILFIGGKAYPVNAEPA